jgi:hypothetical protein
LILQGGLWRVDGLANLSGRARLWRLPVLLVAAVALCVSACKADRGAAAIGPMTEGARHMPEETVYKGRTVHLTATQKANGRWTGAACFPDEPDHVMDAEGEFTTADEARNAALSRAMSEVDRARRFRGKP